MWLNYYLILQADEGKGALTYLLKLLPVDTFHLQKCDGQAEGSTFCRSSGHMLDTFKAALVFVFILSQRTCESRESDQHKGSK